MIIPSEAERAAIAHFGLGKALHVFPQLFFFPPLAEEINFPNWEEETIS